MIKEQIASYIIKKNLKGKQNLRLSFNGLFSKSFSLFVIMPENESDFYSSQRVLEFLSSNKKNITVFTHDFRVSLLPIRFKSQVIDYGFGEITKLNLPSAGLIEKLRNVDVQAAVDLNREDNLFYSYSANLVNSPLRIGIKKNNSDFYYNIQFADLTENADIFYKNFLNFLQMF